MAFKKVQSEKGKKEEGEDLQPVDLTRRTYTYKPGADCPFCGSVACDATVSVDMNPPILDLYRMMDETVTDLPCCVPCGTKHIRVDNRLLKRGEWIGYPLSIFHRLRYRGEVKRWLAANATLDTESPRPPRKWHRRMKQHYLAHALKNAAMTVVIMLVARRISENTGSEFWTVAESIVIIGGSLYVLHALWHVLRFILQPGVESSETPVQA